MGKDKSPAFQFYPSDFLGSPKVQVMTNAEVGIYLRLLCLDWGEGGFELDPDYLARYVREPRETWDAAWHIVKRCFVERDGRWYNPRLEREREKQAAFRAKQSAAGLASAAARFNHRSTNVEPRLNSPSLSPAQATTGGRKRPLNGNDPEPYRPPPFCKACGGGMGKLHPDDRKQVIVHAEGCVNA